MPDIGYRGELRRRQPNGARVLNRSHFAYPNLLAAIPLIGANEVVTGKPALAAPSGTFPTYLGTSRGYGVTTAWAGWGYEVPFRRNASTAFTVLYLTHGGPANTYSHYLGTLGSPGYRLGFGSGDQPFVFIENQNGFGVSIAGAGPTVSGCTAVALSVSGIGSTVALKAALNGGYGTASTSVAGHALNNIVNCYPIWHDGAGAPSWFGGYGMAVFDREFSEAELRAVTLQPWALYTTPRSPVFYSFGGGGDTLVIADATHGHLADNFALTQVHQLALTDATHGNLADSISLTQQHQLAVANATHAHAADNVTLAVQHVLAILDAAHAHAADNVTLQLAGTLAIDSATHGHAAANVVLTQAHLLAIADALHAHGADNMVLEAGSGFTLAIQDALHAHGAGNVALTQVHALVVSDALHAHLAQSLTLALPGALIDHNRLLLIRAEDRILVIAAESRLWNIPADDRILIVH